MDKQFKDTDVCSFPSPTLELPPLEGPTHTSYWRAAAPEDRQELGVGWGLAQRSLRGRAAGMLRNSGCGKSVILEKGGNIGAVLS